jgi:hypothetical protein
MRPSHTINGSYAKIPPQIGPRGSGEAVVLLQSQSDFHILVGWDIGRALKLVLPNCELHWTVGPPMQATNTSHKKNQTTKRAGSKIPPKAGREADLMALSKYF